MTDQAGTFDVYADEIIHRSKKAGKAIGGRVVRSEGASVGAGAVAGSFFGPVGALIGGFIGYLVFEGFKE